MGPMDAVQHADAVTRRVEALASGWVVSLSRVVPGRPRTVWPHWEGQAAGLAPALVAEQVEAPSTWRGRWEEPDRTGWVAVDLGADGGQTVVTVQHAVPDDAAWQQLGPAGVGLRWDGALRELGQALDPDGPASGGQGAGEQTGDAAEAGEEAEQEAFWTAVTDLWVVAAVQSGAPQDEARAAAERALAARC